jgi:beta-lactamase class C
MRVLCQPAFCVPFWCIFAVLCLSFPNMAQAAQPAPQLVPAPVSIAITPPQAAKPSDLNLSLVRSQIDRYHYVAELDRQLQLAAETDGFVGLAVAVVHGGETTLLRTYGDTRVDREDPVDETTVFRLASVSKTMASSLVGQLAEEGRLSWTDRVSDIAPAFRLRSSSATRAVTLEHLASHRTGLPDHAYDNLLEAGYSRERVLERSARLKLRCKPGDCYTYQNSAYSLLGDAVEKATGTPFDVALQQRFFDPLGMETASVGLREIMMQPSWARPHVYDRKQEIWLEKPMSDSYYKVEAAGGINGSILDLVAWARAQLGYSSEVLGLDVRNDLFTPRVDTPRELRKWHFMADRLKDADYGLGWRIYDYAGERLVFHAGGLSGYRAFVGFLPDRDFAVVALWNTSSGAGWRILPTALDLSSDCRHMTGWVWKRRSLKRLNSPRKAIDAVRLQQQAVSVISAAQFLPPADVEPAAPSTQ